MGTLEKGGYIWTDRSYRFGDLPDEVVGGTLFSGPFLVHSTSIITLRGGQEGAMYAFLSKGRDGAYTYILENNGWKSTSLQANWIYTSTPHSKHDMVVYRKTTLGSEKVPTPCCGATSVVFGFAPSSWLGIVS